MGLGPPAATVNMKVEWFARGRQGGEMGRRYGEPSRDCKFQKHLQLWVPLAHVTLPLPGCLMRRPNEVQGDSVRVG